MEMIEYDKFVRDRSTYPKPRSFAGLLYTVLALCGEAGETANILKKVARDKSGVVGLEDHKKLVLELGDVLWYVTAAAAELGVNLSYVARENMTKLICRELEKDRRPVA